MAALLRNSLLVLLIALKIVSIILYILITTKTSFNVDYDLLLDLTTNWKKPLINDIFIKQEECDPSKGEINILEGNYWIGTIVGCFCEASKELFKGNCASINKPTCTDVPGSFKVKYSKWRDSFICYHPYKTSNMKVSNDSAINMFDYPSRDSKSSCLSGEKKCGYLDDNEESMLCVPENDPCPVSDVYMVRKAEPDSPKYENYTKISNENVKVYFINNSTTNPFPSRFKISNPGPCLDPNYYVIPRVYSLFPEEVVFGTESCPQRFPSDYVKTVDENFFYYSRLNDQNREVKEIVDKLPNFSETKPSYINLYSQVYNKLLHKSLNSVKSAYPNTTDFFKELQTKLSQNDLETFRSYSIIGIIIAGTTLLLFGVAICTFSSTLHIKIITSVGLALSLLELIPLSLLLSKKLSHPFILIENMTDNRFTTLIGASSLNDLNSFITAVFIVSLISIIVFIARFVYVVFFKRFKQVNAVAQENFSINERLS